MESKHAKAFLEVALANKSLVTCAKGFLGVDTVPEKLEDFDSSQPETLDRCEAFLAYALEALTIVRTECSRRPRNPRQKDTTEAITEAKDRAERQKTSKGDQKARDKAVAALRGEPAAEKPPKGKAKKKATGPRAHDGRPPASRRTRKAAGSISRSKGRGTR